MEFPNRGFRFLPSKEMEDNSDTTNFTITTTTNDTGGDQVVSATVDNSSAAAAGSGGGGGGGGELEEGSSGTRRREHMFNKVVTPSDVGKLNRLVIPKQHAERYFPLDTSSNEKGLILNFEDTTGKSWRFRYSYWNSSQSYVMTKGWSRFVKEKRLDAGDTVSFERSIDQLSGEIRMFISWKRRQDTPPDQLMPRLLWPVMPGQPQTVLPSLQRPGYYDYYSYGVSYTEPTPNPLYYLRSRTAPPLTERGDHTSSSLSAMAERRIPAKTVLNSEQDQGKTANKSVRLFGVNLECAAPMEVEDDDNQESGGSSTGCGVDGDGLCSSSSMENWLSQSPSHLQLRLGGGGDDSRLSMSTNPKPDLSRKGKHPSLSFDM